MSLKRHGDRLSLRHSFGLMMEVVTETQFLKQWITRILSPEKTSLHVVVMKASNHVKVTIIQFLIGKCCVCMWCTRALQCWCWLPCSQRLVWPAQQVWRRSCRRRTAKTLFSEQNAVPCTSLRWFPSWLILWPCRWRWYVPQRCRCSLPECTAYHYRGQWSSEIR